MKNIVRMSTSHSIFIETRRVFTIIFIPANMKIIDTVTVDARTVNDVKISEDGKVGVITREGASNMKSMNC